MSFRGPWSLVGFLVVCAGVHLLWQSRREIFYWLETFLKIFRKSLGDPMRTRALSTVRPELSRADSRREHVLRLVLGLSLVLLIGPVLIFLGLSF